MKKVVGFILLLTLILIMVGCGVSAGTYAEVLSERDVLEDAIDTSEAERVVLVAQVELLSNEKEELVSEQSASASAITALENEISFLQDERNKLEGELNAVRDRLVAESIGGFSTLTEYRDWIKVHEQPGTQYMEDALLAANRVQDLALEDGYLMGISVDVMDWIEGESALIGVTAFVGNELYWWYVEDSDLFYGLDLDK